MSTLTVATIELWRSCINTKPGWFVSQQMGKSGEVMDIKDFHQYVVKVDGSGCLILRNCKCYFDNSTPGWKTLGIVLCPERTNIPCRSLYFCGL